MFVSQLVVQCWNPSLALACSLLKSLTKATRTLVSVCVWVCKRVCGAVGDSSVPSQQEKKVSQGEFAVKELELFERRYENGYDLTHDMQCSLWLAVFHPDAVKG